MPEYQRFPEASFFTQKTCIKISARFFLVSSKINLLTGDFQQFFNYNLKNQIPRDQFHNDKSSGIILANL